jgi:hypothetical protein
MENSLKSWFFGRNLMFGSFGIPQIWQLWRHFGDTNLVCLAGNYARRTWTFFALSNFKLDLLPFIE